MNPEIQKKIDRIAELVRRRDAIDRELADILGVPTGADSAVGNDAANDTIAAPTAPVRKCGACGQSGHTWRTCSKEKADRKKFFDQIEEDETDEQEAEDKPLVPPIQQRPKLNYDKEALEADIRSGHLKPTTIAERHGVSIATVYQITSVMKKEGRLDRDVPKAVKEKKAPYGRTLAEIDRNSSDIDPELKEQIKDLRDEDKTTTEIAAALGLDYDLVARVPARPKNQTDAKDPDDDDLPEELAPEEEDEDTDDDDAYDPFMRNRDIVAGGEI